MPLEMHCPLCRAMLGIPDDLIGQNGDCPYCGRGIVFAPPQGIRPAESDPHLEEAGTAASEEPAPTTSPSFDFGPHQPQFPQEWSAIDKRAGGALRLIGVCLGWLGLLAAAVRFLVTTVLTQRSLSWREQEGESYFDLVFYFVCGLVTVLGFPLYITGRRMAVLGAREAMKKDRRPPVLLLRAFSEDASATADYGAGGVGWVLGVGWKTTLEQVLTEVFRHHGPVVAIGRPGHHLPPDGASRLWVGHDDWQQQIDELLAGCRYVVMILGMPKGEDGLAWEVRKVFSLATPQKLVLVVPPLDEEEIKRRWQRYRELSKGKLPPYKGGEISAVFSRRWRCEVLRVSWARKPSAYRLIRVFPSKVAGE